MDINNFISNYFSIVFACGILFGGLGSFVSLISGYSLISILDFFKQITR